MTHVAGVPRGRSRYAVAAVLMALLIALLPGPALAAVSSSQVPESGAIPFPAFFETADEDGGRVFAISGSSFHTITEIVGGTLEVVYDFGTADGYYYEASFAADGGYVYWSTGGTVWAINPDDTASGKTAILAPSCGTISSLVVEGTDMYFSCNNDNTIRHAELVPGTSASNVTTLTTAAAQVEDLAYRASDGALFFYTTARSVHKFVSSTTSTVLTGPTNWTQSQIMGIDIGGDGKLFVTRHGASAGSILDVVTNESTGSVATVYALGGYTDAYAYGRDFLVIEGTTAGPSGVVGYFVSQSGPGWGHLFKMTGAIDGLTTVPSAPTGLTASVGNGELTIAFTLGYDGGSAVTDIEYKVDGGAWTSASTTSSPVTVTGLTNGTTYEISIRAVNAEGPGSGDSVTQIVATVPTTPTDVTGTAGNSAATVVFTQASNGGSPITDYEYRIDGGAWTSGGIVASPLNLSSLTNGQTYSIEVRAVNVVGASDSSAAVDVTPAAPPRPPSTPTCSSVSSTDAPCADFIDTTDLDLDTQRELGRLQQIGIFIGNTDGRFGLDDPFLRSHAVWVLQRGHSLIFSGSTPAAGEEFSDTSGSAELDELAAKMRALGLLRGVGDNMFAPDQVMTAGDWAIALERLVLLNQESVAPGQTALERMIASGWMSGGVGANDDITRLDVALSMARLVVDVG